MALAFLLCSALFLPAQTWKNPAGQAAGWVVGHCAKWDANGVLADSGAPCGGGVPSGAIVMVNSGSCPAGYTEDDTFNTFYALGTSTAAGGVGTTGGSTSYTPAGTNSAPTFTGTAQTFATVAKGTSTSTAMTTPNPYTPAGTVSAPSFTGTPATIQPPFQKVLFCKAP